MDLTCSAITLLLFITSGRVWAGGYGEGCTLFLNPCEFEDSECDIITSKCRCVEGKVYNVKTKLCQKDNPLSASCIQTDECPTGNSDCKEGKCICQTGFYASQYIQYPGATCLPQAGYGEDCQGPSGCAEPNTSCVNDVCLCDKGFEWNGERCETAVSKQCDPSQCMDADGTCCCGEGKYLSRQECRSSNETAVIGLQTYVDTTTVTLAWYPPVANEVIGCYFISWEPYINGSLQEVDKTQEPDSGIHSLPSSSVSYEISQLIPGRPYRISVRSARTCKDSTVTHSVRKIAITKPEVPGPMSNESDLDPGYSRQVTFKWEAPPTGEYDDFSLSYKSFSREYGMAYGSRTVKEPSAELYIRGYGREFNVTIRACRNFMKTSSCSDEFKTIVELITKKPTAVQDVSCRMTDPGSIKVTWSPPRKRNGELLKYDVLAMSAAETALTRLENDSAEALDQLKPIVAMTASADGREAVLQGLPKNEIFCIFVYAVNKAGRSEFPGKEDAEDSYKRMEATPRGELQSLFDKYRYTMQYLSKTLMDTSRYHVMPPVCVASEVSEKPNLGRPKRLRVEIISKGMVSVSFGPPVKGLVAGYVLKVKDKKTGTCYLDVRLKCGRGCLQEILDHANATQPEHKDFTIPFPYYEVDDTCDSHVREEFERTDLFPKVHYNITGPWKKRKVKVEVTPVGYFRTGKSVTKTAGKAKPECEVCKSPRDLQQLEERACNVTGVLAFRRGKFKKDDRYIGKVLSAHVKKLLYENRRQRPRKTTAALPASEKKKCRCSLFKEKPNFKLALLNLDTTRTFYVIDSIYSLEEHELDALHAKYKRTCWRR